MRDAGIDESSKGFAMPEVSTSEGKQVREERGDGDRSLRSVAARGLGKGSDGRAVRSEGDFLGHGEA